MMAREFKDSGIEWIGRIPKEWKVKPHKHLMRKIKNICLKYNGEDIISLTMNGVVVRDLNAGGKMPTSFDGYQYVYPGNLLMCLFDIDVTPRCVGLIKNDGLTSPAYSQFTLFDGVFGPYYNYLLRYMDDEKCILHLSKNLRSSLTEDDFGQILTIYPPLNEQQRIADYLDKKCGEIDELIALQEQMIAQLTDYKQSVITEAVTKGLNPDAELVPSGIDWIEDVPKGWKIMPLKWILKKPLQYGANESGNTFDESLPRYVRITDILNNNLREDLQKQSLTEEQANGYILEDNDILFARSGATVGKAFIYKPKYGRCAFAGYLIRAQINNQNDSNFVYYYTQSSAYEEWKKQIFIQATIQNIGADRYSILDIPIPPLSEQQSIATYLDTKCFEIDSLIAIKQQKIETLKDYKKSVIYECVTGKTDIV